MRKTMILALSSALAVPLYFAVPMMQADAATCYESSCNGLDPAATGCGTGYQDAETTYLWDVDHPSDEIGYIQLRYSPTCRTTWALVVGYTGYYVDKVAYPEAQLYYEKGPKGAPAPVESCAASSKEVAQYEGWACQTRMTDDAGYTSYGFGLIPNLVDVVQTASTSPY